jgi:dTDP-4-amino-4,6-dideoxy-D-galactose acyltransferase
VSAVAQLLDWDSRFFGFGVARILCETPTPDEVRTALDQCRTTGTRLIYWHAPYQDLAAHQLAEQHNAWLADRKVTFVMALGPVATAPVDAGIVPATMLTPRLESLAWQSGEYSRFALDKRLPADAFRQLYSQWLRNSLNGNIARAVFTLPDTTGQELGLLTLGEKNGRADIGLLAVDKQARGQRVGKRLVAEARRWAVGAGYAELQVVTQRDNAPACGFYESCGFAISHEEHIYHLWLE